jgi:hypothetical protein
LADGSPPFTRIKKTQKMRQLYFIQIIFKSVFIFSVS